ncbi:MAG: DUF3990 domain-containing protein [Faecalimonas sp.]|nr:DUF3990 domain-containing protein [Faecalimonas sp.]
MIKKLYHGSNQVIECPQFGVGKKYNDYGLGFYCTDNLELAKEWGVSLNQDGYANCYELECEDLSMLNLNGKEYCILHWLTILLKNREFDVPSALALEAKEYLTDYFSIDYEKYDAIIGYRADDSYFSFAQDFINGTISYRQLNEAMHLGRLGQQFVLKSQKAFERIKYLGKEDARSEEWYAKKMLRDRSARRAYFDLERNRRQKGDIYIMQIMDEEMRADDLRL